MSKALLFRLNASLVFIILLSACGQAPPPADTPSEAVITTPSADNVDPIEVVQAVYTDVEQLFTSAKLKLDSIDYTCEETGEAGQLNFYSYQGELRLVRHDYSAGDHFGATENYYVKDGELYFAFIENVAWSFDAEYPSEDPTVPPTKDEITEYRYYYHAAQAGSEPTPIRCLQKDYVLRSAVELPTDPDQIPNQAMADCKAGQEAYQKFLDILQSLNAKGWSC